MAASHRFHEQRSNRLWVQPTTLTQRQIEFLRAMVATGSEGRPKRLNVVAESMGINNRNADGLAARCVACGALVKHGFGVTASYRLTEFGRMAI